jgi:hypothetical protein
MRESCLYFGNATEIQDIYFVYNGLPEVDRHILIFTHHQVLMKSVGRHGSSSLLFMMKMTV